MNADSRMQLTGCCRDHTVGRYVVSPHLRLAESATTIARSTARGKHWHRCQPAPRALLPSLLVG